MFVNIFKKAKLQIYTPVDGEIISIEDVPDPVFSQKMMGEGIAVIPDQGDVLAPVEGKIIQIAPTKHAIGILTKDGTELLIHIGLETVSLKGEGFTLAVAVGDEVSVGQLLMKVDWDFIRTHAKSIITPIVITNSQISNKQFSITSEKIGISGKTIIMTATDK